MIRIPYFPQSSKDTCGAAALRMALAAVGIRRSESQLARLLRLNKKSGVRVEAFPSVLEKYKCAYQVNRNSSFTQLKKVLRGGYVVIVGYFEPEEKIGHYAVVKALTATHIYFLDPYPSFGAQHRLTRARFYALWTKGFRYDKERRWFIGIKK